MKHDSRMATTSRVHKEEPKGTRTRKGMEECLGSKINSIEAWIKPMGSSSLAVALNRPFRVLKESLQVRCIWQPWLVRGWHCQKRAICDKASRDPVPRDLSEACSKVCLGQKMSNSFQLSRSLAMGTLHPLVSSVSGVQE